MSLLLHSSSPVWKKWGRIEQKQHFLPSLPQSWMASRLRFFIMSSHGLVGLLTLCPTRGTSIIELLMKNIPSVRVTAVPQDRSPLTPRSLSLSRVSTVCCWWWGLRQHIVTAAPSELISPATPQSRAKSSVLLSSDVFYCNYTFIFI